MTSSRRNDEAKGYWNHGYNTNSKSSLLLKVKWYYEEDRHKLSSRSKVVLQKDQVAQLKSTRIDIPEQARNDMIGYKLVFKEDY